MLHLTGEGFELVSEYRNNGPRNFSTKKLKEWKRDIVPVSTSPIRGFQALKRFSVRCLSMS